jgi:hypothetical protein
VSKKENARFLAHLLRAAALTSDTSISLREIDMSYVATASSQLGITLKGLHKFRNMTQADVARTSGLRQKTVSLLGTSPTRSSVDSLVRYLSTVRATMSLDLKATTGSPVSGQTEKW